MPQPKKADAKVTVELWMVGDAEAVTVTIDGRRRKLQLKTVTQKQCLILPMYISGMAWMIRIYIRQKQNCLMVTLWRQPLAAEVFH